MYHASRNWLKRLAGGPRIGASTPRPARPRPRHLLLERLEPRMVLSVTIAASNDSGRGYAALDFNASGGYTPPDTSGAAGTTAYVETVNQAVALYPNKSTGAAPLTTSLSNFWFITGGLAHADSGSGLSDPIVALDDQIGRFIVGDQDVNFSTHVSRFDFAVSKTGNPAGLSAADWTFYQFNTTEAGYDADYPGNFGYNHDAFVFTLNMFGTTNHAMVVSVNQADLAANVAPASLRAYKNDLNDASLRPATMHDAVAGDPMWLVTEHGDNKSIDVIKMAGVLSTGATFGYTNLPVAAYSPSVHPLNPNGVAVTTNTDSRIMKAAVANHTLVTTHAVSVSATEDDAQWYAVDVGGATPALSQQGRVGGGPKTYIVYPSIDINPSGQLGMTYMKVGNDTSTDYLSSYVAGRNPGDAAGTMQTPLLVPAGAGQAIYKDFSSGGRAGDLSAINVDPADGSFWAANEFANTETSANWGTAVANFSVSNPLPPADLAVAVSGPSTVAAGTSATYTITVTNNGPNAASGVVLTDTLPAGSTFVSLTQAGGPDAFTPSQAGGTATETANGSVASGSTDTFTLVVSAPASLGNGAAFNDTVDVRATNPDPTTANNTATAAGTVSNTNPNADLSVSVTGPGSSTEGASITYTITVANAGPAVANAVALTETLGSLLNYTGATTTQGTFTAAGGVVTFSLGAIASGSTATATVTAQAIEDGSTSSTASASSSTPDPNAANNSAVASTAIAEPAIVVSAPIRTRSTTLTNFTTATFTHASGVEPTSAFVATIAWGDGSTSAGTISLSGTTYGVVGSHTYASSTRHTITTTVAEAGNAPSSLMAAKFGDNPAEAAPNTGDVVRLPLAARHAAVSRLKHRAHVTRRQAAHVVPLRGAASPPGVVVTHVGPKASHPVARAKF